MRVTGLANLTVSDLTMLDVEAKDWESIYQRRKKQAVAIPASVLEAWGNIASDSQCDIAERIFAWSFRLAAAAGLRWDGLLNASPKYASLIKSGAHWVCTQDQN